MPTKPTKRSLTKTSKQVHNKFHMSLNLLAGLIVLGIVIVFVGFTIKNYLAEQQTLRELDTVGKDLKVIYDKILEANKGNVESSYFQKECSYAYVGPYSKDISCGPSGKIMLNAEVSTADNKIYFEDMSRSVGWKSSIEESGNGVTLDYMFNSTVHCFAGYCVDTLKKQPYYWLGCRKTVPDFLPGYLVEK